MSFLGKVRPHQTQNEGLVFEKSSPGKKAYKLPPLDVPAVNPAELLGEAHRSHNAELPELSEIEIIRHFTRLSTWNYAIDLGMYPLGSCTMKYNPRVNEFVSRIEGLAEAHPYRPESLAQGAMAVVAELEREGFRVIGPDQILRKGLAPEGALGRLRPDAEAMADIAHGARIARALGVLDIGQAVVVQQGLVLGVEAIEGTDELIRRCAGLHREGVGAILVKVEKPGQERRADRPTIGLQTVELAAAAGLRGIAIEAGTTIVIDRDKVAAAADRVGLFVFGIRRM